MGRENFSGGGWQCHMVKTKGITFVCRLPIIELDRVLSLEKQIKLEWICFVFSSSFISDLNIVIVIDLGSFLLAIRDGRGRGLVAREKWAKSIGEAKNKI